MFTHSSSDDQATDIYARVAVMVLIFCVSLFGMYISLPTGIPFDAGSHSCLVSRGFKTNSLFAHSIHCLFCWKALWHRLVPTTALISVFLTLLLGVILSTAFVHLLQDAFDRLQDPDVRRYTGIGHWTGLIVSVPNHLVRH